ncbi:hypothetical protein HERIO_1018 [Hepatospora eriocheir]|uniref:Uncharacterized protein n=1 Tax=Hepatospora eriocheir TaxID=1081669 RepID=A0A1X0QBE4_9MICR|nr:hypothetical protein HERIO_1018 [Hepatospora eriocheir]
MGDYQSVNAEIEDYLSTRLPNDQPTKELQTHNNTTDLKYLLESLHYTYNEINSSLKANNPDGIRDAILRNDIKMSMVNESLLESLRKITNDKDELKNDNKKLLRDKKELLEQLSKSKIALNRIESNNSISKSSINELNRIISDQKDKINQYITTVQKSKVECNSLKTKLADLKNLRLKTTERFSSYEHEMESLNKLVLDREEVIRKLGAENKSEVNKNLTIKTKIDELERSVEKLTQQLEFKEKSLTLCNEEMSKLISSNKKYQSENEKYKNGSTYYENLYKNLNSQNSYLTYQLNKMIKCEEYSKEGFKFFEEAEEKEKKYKKKISKLKSMCDKLNDENDLLKEKLEDKLYKVNPADNTLTLNEKVDDLIKINKEYKNKILQLENQISYQNEQYKNNKNRNDNQKVNFNINNREFKIKNDKDTTINLNNKFDLNELKRKYKLDNERSTYNPNTFKRQTNFNNIKEPKIYFNDLRDINLSRNYEEEIKYQAMPGGLTLMSDNSNLYEQKLDFDYEKDKMNNMKVNEDLIRKMVELNTKVRNSNKDEKNLMIEKYNEQLNDELNNEVDYNPFDVPSEDSIGSFHTTSTLKEMLARTDNLKRKFESLDNELGKIKNTDLGETEKLRNQIRTYNSYYSDMNVDDPDIL